MKTKAKEKTCATEGCENKFTPRFRTTEKYCSSKCYFEDLEPPKIYSAPPNKKSKKRQKEDRVYSKRRKIFLEDPVNQICPVKGIRTTEVHHQMGRVGYADEEARMNGITLFLDERYWLAVSSPGHKLIELQPEWAKRMGYSLNRL